MYDFGPSRRTSPRRLVALAVGLVVLVLGVVLVTYYVIRPAPAKDAGRIVGYTPPPTPVVTGSGPAQKATLNVIIVRGGRTGCVNNVGCDADNYTAILQANFGWNLAVDGHKDTGYLAGAKASPDISFVPRAIAAIQTKPDLLILEGSDSDARYGADAVGQAAQALYTKLKQLSPNTTVVVIGPIWSGTPTARISGIEDALKAAATGRVAKFIDPIAEKWFPTDDTTLVSSDHFTPTNKGHAVIAAKIRTDLATLNLG